MPLKKYKILAGEVTFLSANTWDVSWRFVIILFG